MLAAVGGGGGLPSSIKVTTSRRVSDVSFLCLPLAAMINQCTSNVKLGGPRDLVARRCTRPQLPGRQSKLQYCSSALCGTSVTLLTRFQTSSGRLLGLCYTYAP